MDYFKNNKHNQNNELSIQIASLTLKINCDKNLFIPLVYKKFASNKKPDLIINISETSVVSLKNKRIAQIKEGSIWTTINENILFSFEIYGDDESSNPSIEFNMKTGTALYYLGKIIKDTDVYYRLFARILEITVRMYLIKNLKNGILLHASGINYSGNGMAFIGLSGSGKTTISKIWRLNRSTYILNDDSLILSWEGDKYYICGTPFAHCGLDLVSPNRCKLTNLFFIRHGYINLATKISAVQAFNYILKEAGGDWENNELNIIDHLCNIDSKVGLYDLSFVPNETVIQYILNLLKLK